ncbi:photosynthetic complex putative assembly protein PuhB [Leptothrix discophora]|uniref:Photosynthetic complex putative assembly protein PuhB n=1 Tax=Leptothrix discophora TaxID=89 RepID=A0ABT9G4I1_LEPDI|nr:photosynthetic complex putative assembly protein PuhB [Leptothrix discophora]MDP4301369.1 photosynthetic complex putative assembly protein PuhB [Leptothrix discophora]
MKAVDRLAPEHEHEFEAVPGLPEALPPGETVLWQGRPQALAMARQALRLDIIAVYFAGLMAWRLVLSLMDGDSAAQTAMALARLLPPIAVATGLLLGLGWLMARTTLYTLTNRRVVMRLGIVLGITFNLPLSRIEAARLKPRRDGGGDIALVLAGGDRIAYLHLWPHVRPWRMRQTEPMLRALPQAAEVAQRLSQAWQLARGESPTATTARLPTTAPASSGHSLPGYASPASLA